MQNNNTPSIAYITDATVNNAQTLYSAASPSLASLVDLLTIIQACVLNEVVVVSNSAMQGSALLQELSFADTFHVSQTSTNGELAYNIDAPKGIPVDGEIFIDADDQGNFTTGKAVGDLLLLSAWGETLHTDPAFSSLFIPDPQEKTLGDRYVSKMAAFVVSLQIERNLIKYQDEDAKQYTQQKIGSIVESYSQFARQALGCRNSLGVNVYPSVIEEPLLAMSVAREAHLPLEFLNQFDVTVKTSIEAGRAQAFETWRMPPVGASILAKAKKIDALPKEIEKARGALLKARNHIRRLNIELVDFEQELTFGDDQHLTKLEEHKIRLIRGLEAFTAETEYDAERNAFPITERIWWVPTLVSKALTAAASPTKMAATLANMPWLRRQSYLRYVPGLSSAASYLSKSREPMMRHLIEEVLLMNWEQAQRQSHTMGSALDLATRCCQHSDSSTIENKTVLTIEEDNGDKTDVTEDIFWFLAATNDSIKEQFLLGRH